MVRGTLDQTFSDRLSAAGQPFDPARAGVGDAIGGTVPAALFTISLSRFAIPG